MVVVVFVFCSIEYVSAWALILIVHIIIVQFVVLVCSVCAVVFIVRLIPSIQVNALIANSCVFKMTVSI